LDIKRRPLATLPDFYRRRCPATLLIKLPVNFDLAAASSAARMENHRCCTAPPLTLLSSPVAIATAHLRKLTGAHRR